MKAEPNFFCCLEGTSKFYGGYLTEGEAIEEARRLAGLRENLGKKICVLKIIGFCRAEKISIEWQPIQKEVQVE